MAFTNNPYCQLGDVKLALSLTTTKDDVWLQELIGEAQQVIDDYVGYSFQQDTGGIRKYDGSGREKLIIDDCLSFTTVIETTFSPIIGSGGFFVLGNPQTMDITADCVARPNNTVPFTALARLSGYVFAEGTQNYVVTGNFGYASIPASITRACTRLTIHLYKMRSANYSDQVADSQFGKGIKFIPDMPQDVMDTLEKYRHHYFFVR
jgi:hypothetical protein